MLSSFSAPYNITISNDSPTITYFPYRDGPVSGGWNLTCVNSVDSTWTTESNGANCVGPSSHRTEYVGASLLIEFEGTAAYLYGQSGESFIVQLDDQINNVPLGDPSVELLTKNVGLAFGKHRLFLNVTQQASVSFSQVVLTVGVGNSNSDTYNPQNRTLSPFTSDNLSTLNPQFNYTGTWYSDAPGTIDDTGNLVYPNRHTNQEGAYVTFNLDQTSAFFIYGLVKYNLGSFSVTVIPLLDPGSSVTTFYNTNAHWTSLDRVMYWESGMDRDKQYSVRITNLGHDDEPWWDFSRVEIIDAGSTSGSVGSAGKRVVSAGIIGGATGGSVVILSLLVGFLWYLRRSRSKPAHTTSNIAEESQLPFNYLPPPATQNISYNPYLSTPYGSMAIFPAPDSPTTCNPLQEHGLDAADPEVQSDQLNNPAPPPPCNETISGTQPARPQVVQEDDAGPISPPEGSIVRLPPGYKDAWGQGYE